MAIERNIFKITLSNDLNDLDTVPIRPLCETCIYGTPLFCPESAVMRQKFFALNTFHPYIVDVLEEGLPELIDPTTECESYIEDSKFKDRNMD